MATEIVTRNLCDVCMRDEIKRDGTRWVIVVNGKAHEFDACEEHAAPVADALKVLEEYGRRPSGLSATAPARQGRNDPQTCGLCGLTYKNMGSLTAHARTTHGMHTAEYRAAIARTRRAPVDTLTCPDCGKTLATRKGYASHRRMHERQR